MKTIKNLMVAALVMFAGNAMAQSLSAEAVTIDPASDDGPEADLVIKYESEQDLTGAQFTIALPDGVTIKKNGKKFAAEIGDEDNYEWKIKDGDAGQIVLITRIDNTCDPMISGSDLITLTLVAAEGAVSGKAKISGIVFSNKGTSVKGNDDFEVAIEISGTTGINSLNANNSNEPAFNLAGQKVGKNYKGIVVKNGKKTIVK